MRSRKHARAAGITTLFVLGALVTGGCDLNGFDCSFDGKVRITRTIVRFRGLDNQRKTRHTSRFRTRQDSSNALVFYKALFFPSMDFSLAVTPEDMPTANGFTTFGLGVNGSNDFVSINLQLPSNAWQTFLAENGSTLGGSTQRHDFSGERGGFDLRWRSDYVGGNTHNLEPWGRIHGTEEWQSLGDAFSHPATTRYNPTVGTVGFDRGQNIRFSHGLPDNGTSFPFLNDEALRYRTGCMQTSLQRAMCFADECPPSYVFLILDVIVQVESETDALADLLRARIEIDAKKGKKSPAEKGLKDAEKLLKLYPKVFKFVNKQKTPSGKAIWNKLNGLQKRVLKLVDLAVELEEEDV